MNKMAKWFLVVVSMFFMSIDTAVAYPVTDTVRYPLDSYVVVGNCFGAYNKIGNSKWHLGDDCTAVAGTKVYAISNGIVRHANYHGPYWKDGKYFRNYGGMYIIEHDVSSEKVCALYVHMKFTTFTKTVGQEVVMGECLGEVGNQQQNGDYSEHFHFGIRKGEYPQNPNEYIYGDWIFSGYTSNESVLDSWYSPSTFIAQHSQYADLSAGRYSDGTICEPIQEAYDQNGGVSVLGTPAFCLNPYSDGYVTSWPLLSYVLFQVFDGGSLGECAIVYDTQASPDHAFVMHGQLWEYYQAYNGPLLLLANQAIGGPIGPERSGTNNVNGHSLAVQRMAHGYLIYDTVTGFLDVNTSSSGFTIAMIPGDGESLTLRGWPQSTTSIYLVSNLNSKSEIIHAKGRSALPTGRQALAENPKQITMDQILNPKKYSLS